MKLPAFALSCLAVFLLSSPVRAERAAPPAPAPAPAPEAEAPAGAPAAETGAEPGGPLLVSTADLNVAVHEVVDRMTAVVDAAENAGGFLARQDDTSVIVRIPRARFREALAAIEAIGDVLNRRVAAQDVSDQVRDLRIRLRNSVEMRDRLADLLARANTVPESLTIEQELQRQTGGIEQLRGQVQVLQDRVTYATITVRFQPIQVDQEVPRERFRLPFPWLNDVGLHQIMRF